MIFLVKLHNLANFINQIVAGPKKHHLKPFSTIFDTPE